jgi:hypothetical protein
MRGSLQHPLEVRFKTPNNRVLFPAKNGDAPYDLSADQRCFSKSIYLYEDCSLKPKPGAIFHSLANVESTLADVKVLFLAEEAEEEVKVFCPSLLLLLRYHIPEDRFICRTEMHYAENGAAMLR